MIKKKFIILSEVPLSKKIYKSLYINDLFKIFRKNIEFWDLSNFKYKKNKDPFKLKNKYIKKFDNLTEIKKELKKDPTTKKIVMSLIPISFDSNVLHKMFKQFSCYLIHIVWGYMPNDDVKISQKITKNIFLMIRFKIPISNIIKKLFLKFKSDKSKIFDLVFFAGKKCQLRAKKLSNNYVPTHLVDYDNYLQTSKNKSKITKYCVFLDQAYTCHSDDLTGLKKIKKKHIEYYKSLDTFFCKLEKKYKIKVKIALHPKNYLSKKFFFGRETISGNTAKVVSESIFVLAHTSLSISYAVLNFKPIIFMNSSVFEKYSDFGEDVRIAKILAKYLGSEFLNIDKYFSNHALNFTVKKSLYNKYKYNYIVSRKYEQLSSKKIFLTQLKNSLNFIT